MTAVPPTLPRIRRAHPTATLVRCDYCTRTYHPDNVPDTCRGCGAPVGEGKLDEQDFLRNMALISTEMRIKNAIRRNNAAPQTVVSLPGATTHEFIGSMEGDTYDRDWRDAKVIGAVLLFGYLAYMLVGFFIHA